MLKITGQCVMMAQLRRRQRNRQTANRKLKMSMCRACLVLLSAQDIMYDLVKDKSLAFKFHKCTSISVMDDSQDDMPKCICSSCYQLLVKFYDFQRMCAESIVNFEKLLQEAELQHEKGDNEREVNAAANERMLTEEEEEYAAELALTLEDLIHKEIVELTGELTLTVDKCVTEAEDKPFVDIPCYLETAAAGADKKDTMSAGDLATLEEIAEVYLVNDKEDSIHDSKERVEEALSDAKSGTEIHRGKLICSICTQGFYKQTLLTAHLRKHDGLKPYFCTLCNKSYERKQKLMEHISTTHQKNFHKCPIVGCSKIYKSGCTLRVHIKQYHTAIVRVNEKKFVCEECGKQFTRKMNFERHRYVHLSKEERPYACTHCAQRFYTKQMLLNHLNLHTNTNPYKCEKCSRSYPTRAALTTHTSAAHKPRGRWYCKACNKTYLNASNLRKHEQAVHLNLRRFVCRHCGDRFSRRHHLQDHERRHTGERPYKCEFCDKDFIQKNHCKIHMRNMHGKQSESWNRRSKRKVDVKN